MKGINMPPVNLLIVLSFILSPLSIIPPVKKMQAAFEVRDPNGSNRRDLIKTGNAYSIIIDKSDYELKVYDEEGWYATYPIVFGSKDLGDKMREGDKRTPNGQFTIIQKKMNAKWAYELLLDYPNEACIQRFNERKQRGLLPKDAKIGGGIAIHATRPQEEWTVDNFYNWTDGCISVKYSEMKDLYNYIPVGTPVTIQQ